MESQIINHPSGSLVVSQPHKVLNTMNWPQYDELPPEFSGGTKSLYLYQNQATACIPC